MRLTLFGFKGFLFYLAMTGAYFASPYSNVFFLLVAFLNLQWLLCAAWTLRNARGLEASFARFGPVPAGAGGSVSVVLRAPRGTRFQVAAVLELGGTDRRKERIRGQAEVLHGETLVDLKVPPLVRGLYPVTRAYLSSTYPLGLFERRHAIDAPGELVVPPIPADLVSARSGSEALSDALGQSAGDGDMQPSGLRDHREGDGLRGIHWRASARRGSLVVKEWEGGGGEGLEVLLDRRCSPDELEEALSLIAAVLHLARENKEVLAIYSQDLHATFGEGHRPWAEAQHFLAGAEVLLANGAAPPAVSPSVTRLPVRNGGELAHAG